MSPDAATDAGAGPPGSALDRAGTRRFLVVLALAFVPWTVLVSRQLTLVFPFGLLNTNPPSLLTVTAYLRYSGGAFPGFVEAWLLGAGFYVVALASAGAGALGHEDRRLTGAFLALAAVGQFPLAWGWSVQPRRFGLPVGSLLVLAVAWWWYWPAFRRSLVGEATQD